ncbi:hypothetical protein F5878DRAFT_647717 [Lentinula raphanica]|uniref:Uncharacterized protein n=1 Tax=Lentinula raphanica TaxID=153919 RepID=A0AA38NVF7_9AGAR|nr:hypothetical protein F5878DRAFT_647717 [Lentinula raphanica]
MNGLESPAHTFSDIDWKTHANRCTVNVHGSIRSLMLNLSTAGSMSLALFMIQIYRVSLVHAQDTCKNVFSCAHASGVDLVFFNFAKSLDDLDQIYGAIFIGFLLLCMYGACMVAIMVAAKILFFLWKKLSRYVSTLLAPWAKVEELKRREEQIRLREMELAQFRVLQIDVDIQVHERLAQFFERSADIVRNRVHELQTERELFADTTSYNE